MGVAGLWVTGVLFCNGAAVDSNDDIDIGCCSPPKASVIDGNDSRCDGSESLSSPDVLRVSGGEI